MGPSMSIDGVFAGPLARKLPMRMLQWGRR